jgi:16S rRNA (uracil1498-N3)-methyltransferase
MCPLSIMARRRFYAPACAFTEDRALITLDADEARHLRDVLRMRVGEEVYTFDGGGHEFRCSIEVISRHSASLRIVEEVAPKQPESPLRLTLAVALLKGEKLDLVAQKATELGVSQLVLVETENSDVRPREADRDKDRRYLRLQRIVLEAAKQSGRARLPVISGPRRFGEIIAAAESSVRLLFVERGGDPLPRQIQAPPIAALTALVGPEGGWSDAEIHSAFEAGWSLVTLGGRTLRAETAAITVAALMQHLYGDLK